MQGSLMALLKHQKYVTMLNTPVTVDGHQRTVYDHIIHSPEKIAIFLEVLDSDIKFNN